MAEADGGHDDDFTVEQLHAVARMKNAHCAELVKLLHRKAVRARWRLRHGCDAAHAGSLSWTTCAGKQALTTLSFPATWTGRSDLSKGKSRWTRVSGFHPSWRMASGNLGASAVVEFLHHAGALKQPDHRLQDHAAISGSSDSNRQSSVCSSLKARSTFHSSAPSGSRTLILICAGKLRQSLFHADCSSLFNLGSLDQAPPPVPRPSSPPKSFLSSSNKCLQSDSISFGSFVSNIPAIPTMSSLLSPGFW